MLDNGAISISTPARGDAVAAALSDNGVVLLKNHGVVVAAKSIAEVCVTALRIEKAAETMLRAAALVKLPLMSDEKKAGILEARKGVESSGIAEERWRMLQDYYLGSDR